jgi:hypothetical protein
MLGFVDKLSSEEHLAKIYKAQVTAPGWLFLLHIFSGLSLV